MRADAVTIDLSGLFKGVGKVAALTTGGNERVAADATSLGSFDATSRAHL